MEAEQDPRYEADSQDYVMKVSEGLAISQGIPPVEFT